MKKIYLKDDGVYSSNERKVLSRDAVQAIRLAVRDELSKQLAYGAGLAASLLREQDNAEQ